MCQLLRDKGELGLAMSRTWRRNAFRGPTLDPGVVIGTGEALVFVRVAQGDPLAVPLLDALAVEYSQRYGGAVDRHREALRNYPAAEFAAPDGALIVGLLDGVPVTGGAFRRFDADTAELKRIWTDTPYRRRRFARRVLDELEVDIVGRGYRRVYLMTGDRQPEAERLYESAGYVRLSEPLPAAGPVYPVAFEKVLR